jgi:hypothetical protein
MAIVKYKNQSGVTYAYEQTSVYDPEKKQSRPIRKYLGRVDPETGEIISTQGKRGRPRKHDGADEGQKTQEMNYKELYEQKCRECELLRKKLSTSYGQLSGILEHLDAIIHEASSIHSSVSSLIEQN